MLLNILFLYVFAFVDNVAQDNAVVEFDLGINILDDIDCVFVDNFYYLLLLMVYVFVDIFI